jgi:hypothetical protein
VAILEHDGDDAESQQDGSRWHAVNEQFCRGLLSEEPRKRPLRFGSASMVVETQRSS